MAKKEREYDVDYTHRVQIRLTADVSEALKKSCKENVRTQQQEINYALRKLYELDKKKK